MIVWEPCSDDETYRSLCSWPTNCLPAKLYVKAVSFRGLSRWMLLLPLGRLHELALPVFSLTGCNHIDLTSISSTQDKRQRQPTSMFPIWQSILLNSKKWQICLTKFKRIKFAVVKNKLLQVMKRTEALRLLDKQISAARQTIQLLSADSPTVCGNQQGTVAKHVGSKCAV